MSAREHITAYYDALRNGQPLSPFFSDQGPVVKFGIDEALDGYEAVVEGLQSQTETTASWDITSHQLRVGRSGKTAWFADLVTMDWTDTERNASYTLDTRWSGTLVNVNDQWGFVAMHVSVPYPYYEEHVDAERAWIQS